MSGTDLGFSSSSATAHTEHHCRALLLLRAVGNAAGDVIQRHAAGGKQISIKTTELQRQQKLWATWNPALAKNICISFGTSSADRPARSGPWNSDSGIFGMLNYLFWGFLGLFCCFWTFFSGSSVQLKGPGISVAWRSIPAVFLWTLTGWWEKVPEISANSPHHLNPWYTLVN